MLWNLPKELQFTMKSELITQIEAVDFINRSLQQAIAKAAQDEKKPLGTQDLILMRAITSPKISQQFLDSDDYDTSKTSILAVSLLDEYGYTEDRILDLKKKVRSQSD